jgi:hypothetical protein
VGAGSEAEAACRTMTIRLSIESISLEFQDPECLDSAKVYEQRVFQSGVPVHVYYDEVTRRPIVFLMDFIKLPLLRSLASKEVEAEITKGTRENMDRRYQEALRVIRENMRTGRTEHDRTTERTAQAA